MTWDPKDVKFTQLTAREQAKALRVLAIRRRREAQTNAAAGYRAIAEVQVEQAKELEARAAAIEEKLR